jgi:hypothetical protein
LAETVEHVVHASGLFRHYRARKTPGSHRQSAGLINAAQSFVREVEREVGEDIDDPLTSFCLTPRWKR